MACPYCGEPEDVLDDVYSITAPRYPHLEIIFNAHCEACNKHFRQKYWAEVDDNRYENIKEEDYESE